MTKDPQRQVYLEELANALLIRHLQVSWPEPLASMPTWLNDGTPSGYRENLRTVAVVGAGASYPMESIGEELADELEKELDSDAHDREVELDRLENVYGLSRSNFETRLTAICRTPESERRVRERISESYRHRHPSLLTYELLAHLLHHRFLDAIISFNFDELLDQAIEDELGPNEYESVITERDCNVDHFGSVPLYIKMHGTAAEPDSLRFTRERYYWTPKPIIELVEKQFEVEHLVLMNVGYRLASFDFQYLLGKPEHLGIYHLDPKKLTSDVTKEINNRREQERTRQKVERPESYDKPEIVNFTHQGKDPGCNFLPNLLQEVIDALQKRCKEDDAETAAWRSTLRHNAIVEVLGSSPIDTPTQHAEYLRRRTILELAFAAARGRGVLSIASMVNDRCGRYYDRYQRAAGNSAERWEKLCRAGGLEESRPDHYEVLEHLRYPVEEADLANIHCLKLADPAKVAAHLIRSMNVAEEDADRLTGLLTKTLSFLQEETEIEVHSRDDRICSKTFVEPVILETFTALQGWTQHLLESTKDYNELWAVSESGDWLKNKPMLKALKEHCDSKDRPTDKMSVRLLAAFESDLPEIEPITETLLLPWGRHNRHMTIICKDGQPRAAIFFVRRLRAPTVTPVYLSHQKDLGRIAEAFEKLWDDAKKYKKTEELRDGAEGAKAKVNGAGGNGQAKRSAGGASAGNRAKSAAGRS